MFLRKLLKTKTAFTSIELENSKINEEIKSEHPVRLAANA